MQQQTVEQKRTHAFLSVPITASTVDLYMLDTFSLRQAAEKLNMHIYHGLLSIRESACKKLVAMFAEILQMVDGESINLKF